MNPHTRLKEIEWTLTVLKEQLHSQEHTHLDLLRAEKKGILLGLEHIKENIKDYKEAYEKISKDYRIIERENKSLHRMMGNIVKNADNINNCLNKIYQNLSDKDEEVKDE